MLDLFFLIFGQISASMFLLNLISQRNEGLIDMRKFAALQYAYNCMLCVNYYCIIYILKLTTELLSCVYREIC